MSFAGKQLNNGPAGQKDITSESIIIRFKDNRPGKIFEAPDWLAVRSSPIPGRFDPVLYL
jgi:hypothetical protein